MKKLVIVFLLISAFSSLVFAQDENTYLYEKNLGEKIGEIYGQKDAIKHEAQNWEKIFNKEVKNIKLEYNLKNETEEENFKNGFKNGYLNGYKTLNVNNSSDCDIGVEHGKMFGAVMGNIYGKKDFFDKKVSNWLRNFPSDLSIKSRYRLNEDTKEYAESFIAGYKASYKENYILTFREMNTDCKKDLMEKGILHGNEMGKRSGEILGKVDYEINKINDWTSALSSDKEIIDKFYLLKEDLEYRVGFLAGYKEGFQKEYTSAFHEANIDRAKGNMDYMKVSIEGGEILSPDQIAALSIEEGTIYQPSYFNLSKRDFPLNIKKYEPLTNIYKVTIENSSHVVNIKKPMILSFKYLGPETGGIYQYINNEWNYLYSTIEKDRIFTEIPTGTYTGGTYIVCIDENYQELIDIYSHWAQKELYSFIRRGILKGYEDHSFKPDQPITTSEFFALIEKINKNNICTEEYINNYKISAKDLMSYEEAEQIIQNITNVKTFSWDIIGEKMMYEKFTRSKSSYGKNKNMTRAEAVYMLYILKEEKIL